MSPSSRTAAALLSPVLALTGTWLLVVSVRNNPLEGWGMLFRALAGHAAWIAAVECGANAAGRSPRPARILAARIMSVVLTPCAAIIVLMSKESGPSWALCGLILLIWFAATGVVAFSARRR